MRTLHLTTPFMHGADVKAAQHLLAKSRFGDFHPGRADGSYGEHSAAATRRAKYWLGYSRRHVNARYGSELAEYLERRRLGRLKRARRAARLWHLKHIDRRARMLRIAESQIGTAESPPDSNRVKYSEWYGEIGPWCAMFVSWCAHRAGLRFHYAYVPFVVSDARARRNGLRALSSAQVEPGDLACYDWNGDGIADHIGIFKHWDVGGAIFEAVEGNTSAANDSNGGEVMQRQRYISQVQQFVRIG